MVASASPSLIKPHQQHSDNQRMVLWNRNVGDGVHGKSPPPEKKEQKLIGYRGNWYDVTNFVDRHPGGDVIKSFVGGDATSVIESFHSRNVLKHWKPVSSFQPDTDEFEKEMLELEKYLTENGYYDSSISWYIMKCCLVFLIFLTIIGTSVAGLSTLNYGTMAFSGFLLALLWQQSGMIMHDAMHSQITTRSATDELIGLLFGSVFFGISSKWWKDEHIPHHALTNTIDDNHECMDPQADEICWAQNQLLFTSRMRSKLSTFLCTIQSWTFFPFTVFLGRIGITVDSMRLERNADVWLAWLLHVTWLAVFFRSFPTWWSCVAVYAMGCIGEGVLHIQLLINHYAKPFYELKERRPQQHYRYMVECNLNVITPVYMDWFHGGLNFHHEHHCFPRLPRNRLREVSPMIRERCRRHGIKYDEMGFFQAIHNTTSQLHQMQIDFMKVDIRKL